MKIDFDHFPQYRDAIFVGNQIILDDVEFVDIWTVGQICARSIAIRSLPDRRISFPKTPAAHYVFRHLGFLTFLDRLGFDRGVLTNAGELPDPSNPDIDFFPIQYSERIDEFNGRLEGLLRMFEGFSMSNDDARLATQIVAELGNNVFDHNIGQWPDLTGSIVAGMNLRHRNTIEFIVLDAGIGFKASLRAVNPNLSDAEAIKLGLSGQTGRIAEDRGRGLKYVQSWTIDRFHGKLRIQSGTGCIQVDKRKTKDKDVESLPGVLASFLVTHKPQR